MKPFAFFLAVFLLAGGIFSVSAQDLLINTETTPITLTEMADGSRSTAMNPNRPTFGIYVNPIGFLAMGPVVGVECTILCFDADVHLRFPQAGLLMRFIETGWDDFENGKLTSGFGLGFGLKYFYHTRIGGFYAGPFFEYSQYKAEYEYEYDEKNKDSEVNTLAFGANLGYKFAWSHIYLRLGAYFGGSVNTKNEVTDRYGTKDRKENTHFFFMADVAVGVSF